MERGAGEGRTEPESRANKIKYSAFISETIRRQFPDFPRRVQAVYVLISLPPSCCRPPHSSLLRVTEPRHGFPLQTRVHRSTEERGEREHRL